MPGHQGHRSRGRQRKRWIDIVKYDLDKLQLTVVDAEDRAEWRRRTRVADLTKGIYSVKETDRERPSHQGRTSYDCCSRFFTCRMPFLSFKALKELMYNSNNNSQKFV